MVMDRIWVQTLPGTKVSRRPTLVLRCEIVWRIDLMKDRYIAPAISAFPPSMAVKANDGPGSWCTFSGCTMLETDLLV